MNLVWTEEQKLLRDSVERFCRSEIPTEKMRALAEEGAGLTDHLWRQISEQAWLAVMIPEEYGGLGLGVTELGIILEEMGRALVPGPYFSTVALGAPAILLGGSAAHKGRWLERMARGEVRATVAILEEEGVLGPDFVRARAEKTAGGFVLNGRKYFVPDLDGADLVVVVASTGSGGITLFLLERSNPGISVGKNLLTDTTGSSGQLYLEDARVSEESVLGEADRGWPLVEQVLRVANVAIAAGSVAAAESVLAQAVEYARKRIQFGVPIGTFQAVKHPLADLFAEIESARSAYHYAAWAVDAGSQQAASAVAVARLTCAEAYRHSTLVSLQAHGGIGFTWEYDLHLHLKRALHNQYLLGVPTDYEEIVARESLRI